MPKHTVTRRNINVNRAIKGGAMDARAKAVDLTKLVGVEFAKKDGMKFTTVQRGVLDLLENGLGSLESLVRNRAISIADANTPDKITKKAITGIIATHKGVGGTLEDMTTATSATLLRRVGNTMARMNAENYSSDAIRAAIVGTAGGNYLDGVLASMINGSELLSKTASLMASESANDAYRRDTKTIIGYIWVSVLDGSTTVTCADLNGREFYYADSGEQPLPPQHFGCRSTTDAIYENKDVPVVTSIWDFIKDNPDEARDMLGKTRYDLVTKGKLDVNRLTDRQYQPLTIDQLRERNAVAFKRLDKAAEMSNEGVGRPCTVAKVEEPHHEIHH